ncbi:BTAD domain-containing putative transcriptional regulator [Pelomonas parva]|uniref:BTAD domain-containing putative transcriptional regulator n=1 Tax=Pelomonas parva TaxID=3299032 RepID=A0ABW7EY73_9BURK
MATRPPAGPNTAPNPRLSLLHAPALTLPDGTRHPLAAKDAALLALLALDGPTPRAQLAALLWPEAGVPQARNNLRQRLFRLHRLAGRDLVLQGEPLTLAADLAHDLAPPAEALQDDAGAAAGSLLGSLNFEQEPALARWVEHARERWRSQLRDLLAGVASKHEDEHRIAEALPYAERLARDEPLLEHAQRQLMRLHYRRGDRGAALAVYERLRDTLDRELGETPSPESRQLAALIEASQQLPSVLPQPAPVAVLCPPRLVGREAEWQAMSAAWARGAPLLLLGEPGIGKSRLLADFAQAQGLRCRVQARPGDLGVPYALLARLLRAWFTAHADAPPPEPWVRAELARCVPELGTPAVGVANALRLRAAVAQALQHTGGAGIAIDDLQFADEATLELLTGGLLGDEGGVRWLLAARRAEVPAAVRAWVASAMPAVVALGPLDAAGVQALLASVAEADTEMHQLAASLHRHTGGSPLFLLQTLLEWLRHGRRPLGEGQALPFPADVLRLIQHRLDALSPDAVKLARIAALAGMDFEVALGAAVLERHPLDLLAPWRELEQALVINEQAFVHDLVREACVAAIPKPIRAWLHRRVAQWLAAERPATPPARLAAHWAAAGDAGAAARAWLQAAQYSRDAGRIGEQARALRSAAQGFASAGLAPERFHALTQLVIATRESQSPAEALPVADELLAAADGPAQHGVALKEQAVCHMNAMRHDIAAPLLQQAVALLQTSGNAQALGHAQYMHALCTARSIGPAHATTAMLALLPWAKQQVDESQRQCFNVDLGIVLDQSDQRTRARPHFEAAIAFFERHGELANLASTHLTLGRSLVQLGALPAATRHLERAVALRNELSGGVAGQGIDALSLGRAWVEGGRYADAIALLEPLIERLDGQGMAVVSAAARHALARAFAMLGQPARVRQVLGAQPDSAPPFQQAQALWTEALAVQAQPAERRALLERALACFTRGDMPYVRLPIAFDLLALQGDADALARFDERLAECEARELPAARLLGLARRVPLLPAHETAPAITTLLAEMDERHSVGAYLPELLAGCANAALQAGEAKLATRCRERARRWIYTVALPQVPAAFRDSFLQRNPFNRGLA